MIYVQTDQQSNIQGLNFNANTEKVSEPFWITRGDRHIVRPELSSTRNRRLRREPLESSLSRSTAFATSSVFGFGTGKSLPPTGELPATTAGFSTGALASVGTDGTDVLAGSAVTEVKLPNIAATFGRRTGLLPY